MSIKETTLPEDTTLLKQMLVDLQGHHNKQTDILLEEISLLRAQLYGRKSVLCMALTHIDLYSPLF